ncbi:MAG: E3 binding domain-containing protein [Armatimonadota bacterium]|nr:E3 binding domain-containing protein [Armatimonadota bacterium]
MVRIILERLYPDMKEATVGRWLKQEGEEVAEGEPIVELITDKVTFELESPSAGPLRQICVAEKSVIPIGCTLALLAAPDEVLPDVAAENRARIAAWEAEVSREASLPAASRLVGGTTRPQTGEGVRATPSARRLARQHGVDLLQVPHSGDGPLTERDVRAFLEARQK